ncbi:Bro-N domain-containing protein [Acidithiobacillus sp. IBUN Pt1247-S3]|uniref:BRO-N domain-containing protein n=1 Tax=Acidithiobacillus sp. IBUN Pt1247-S3 TaxID=3166642 RepID=UPI0034E45FEE
MTTPISGVAAPEQALTPVSFQFHSLEVRTIDRDGQVWFVASDVAQALGYRNADDMTRWLDEDEADTHNLRIRSENGVIQTREVTILSESGLYHALLKSRRPEAKPFRRWVTQEVLPAIRQQGGYGSPPDISERLQYARFLATFDEEGRLQLKQIAEDACILSPTNAGSMTTLMREFIPGALLPDLMRIGLDRLARMAGRNNLSGKEDKL